MIMAAILSIILAYLLGSISTSIILAKVTGQQDPRNQGSGNAGATNVLRNQGKRDALIVLLGDALKGVIAVLIGHWLGVNGVLLGLVGAAAVAGHIFPIYFKFKGGKGVATGLGVIFALSVWIGVFAVLSWLAIALISRYASLASLVATVVATFLMLIPGTTSYFIPMLIISALIFWKHAANIQRLREGTENKINL